jgi:hypothetical protein
MVIGTIAPDYERWHNPYYVIRAAVFSKVFGMCSNFYLLIFIGTVPGKGSLRLCLFLLSKYFQRNSGLLRRGNEKEPCHEGGAINVGDGFAHANNEFVIWSCKEAPFPVGFEIRPREPGRDY